jgi:arylsulfatase A-like enzyme
MISRNPMIVTTCIILTAVGSFGMAEGYNSKDKQPNILIIAIDTLRSDCLGCYGCSKGLTPHIDELAAKGVLFEQCYSAASWTPPSFASIFTGLMPFVHGILTSDGGYLIASLPTLPEQFQEKGYFCGAIISNPLLAGKFGFARGFELYDEYSVYLDLGVEGFGTDLPAKHDVINNMVSSCVVTDNAKQLLHKAQESHKSFFLFIHYMDPHDNYIPPPPYDQYDPFYDGDFDGHSVANYAFHAPAKRDTEHLRALYDGEIAYTDSQVGELLQAIYPLANTLTILISDHGEAFGEHGTLQHGKSPYREEVAVPMIWHWPAVLPQGHRVKAPVSTLDIAKTFAELFSFEKMKHLQGQSLWPGLSGGQISPDRKVFSQKALSQAGLPDHHIALTQNHMRCHASWYNHSEHDIQYSLYDLSRDPEEKTDIRDTLRSEFSSMKSSLSDFRVQCDALCDLFRNSTESIEVTLTEEELRQLESLGYLHTDESSH